MNSAVLIDTALSCSLPIERKNGISVGFNESNPLSPIYFQSIQLSLIKIYIYERAFAYNQIRAAQVKFCRSKILRFYDNVVECKGINTFEVIYIQSTFNGCTLSVKFYVANGVKIMNNQGAVDLQHHFQSPHSSEASQCKRLI